MKLRSIAALALLGCFVIAGCNEDKTKGEVIAKIGNEKITVSDFNERVRSTPPAYQAYIKTEPGKKQFVDLMVREKLLLASAKETGVDKREEYKQSVKDFKEEQKKQLKDFEDGLLIELFIKDLQTGSITPTENEINEYYEDNKTDFTNPVAVTAKHILVQSKQDAETALSRIKSGESFDKVAKEMSTDRVSAEKGGLIGPFRKGELVPEFEEAVFNLKKGEISEIIETPFGFHIITKVSEQNLPPVPEETAKAEIKKMLGKTKFENWFEETKKKINVSVDYSKLDAVKNTDAQDGGDKDEILGKFSN